MLTITIDDAAVKAELQALQRRVGDLSPVMERIGQALAESTKRHIEAGTDWRGQPFAPNKPSTLKKKKGSRPLIDTGTLLHNRIHHSADAHSATVGVGGVQAAVMQFGQKKGASGMSKRGRPIPWGDIPARPYLPIAADAGIEPEAVTLVMAALRAWVADTGK